MDMTYFRKTAGMKLTTPKNGHFKVSQVYIPVILENTHTVASQQLFKISRVLMR